MPKGRATSPELERRAALAASRHHDPRVLWPETDPRRLSEAELALSDVLRSLLRGEHVELRNATDAMTFGRAAFRLGVGALLGHYATTGRLDLAPETGRVMMAHLEHGRRRYARLAEITARLVRLCRADDIEPVIIKGAGIAAAYPEVGARPFQDVDLYVPPRFAARAERIMRREGLQPGPLGAGRRRNWYQPAALASLDFTHVDNPWSVDLHFGLGRLYNRAIIAELPEPDASACPSLEIGGESVRVLPPAHHAALLAMHVSSELYMLQLIRPLDLVQISRAHGADCWREFQQLLLTAGSIRFAYPALVLAERLAPGSVPPDTLQWFRQEVSPRLRRAVELLPLRGLARWDRLRPPYLMLWAGSLADVIRIVAMQLAPRGVRQRLEHRAFRRHLRELHGPLASEYTVT